MKGRPIVVALPAHTACWDRQPWTEALRQLAWITIRWSDHCRLGPFRGYSGSGAAPYLSVPRTQPWPRFHAKTGVYQPAAPIFRHALVTRDLMCSRKPSSVVEFGHGRFGLSFLVRDG